MYPLKKETYFSQLRKKSHLLHNVHKTEMKIFVKSEDIVLKIE